MASVRQIVDELRRRGVTVHEWPGWDGRGNEGVGHIDARGGIIHHTGSNYGSAYAGLVVSTRPDLLGGMLCNFAGNEDGSLTVIGSGLAWHAAPASGPSLGALAPYGRSLNRYTVGLEIVYPGTSPMRPAQYQTALVFAKTVADLCAGGNVEAIRAHAEASPSGKWDPGYAPDQTIDMAAFRRNAATANSITVEDDMQLGDRIKGVTNAQGQEGEVSVQEALGAAWELGRGGFLQAMFAGLNETIRTLAEARDEKLDVEALLARVNETVKTAMADTVSVDITVGGQEK